MTANRFSQPLSSVLTLVSVVTREDIDHGQIKSVTEALSWLLGVDIGQNGDLGQQSSRHHRQRSNESGRHIRRLRS